MAKAKSDLVPATLRLKLRYPVLATAPADRKAAWAHLNDIFRCVSVGIQNGLADVLVHLRGTGYGELKRLPTPAEREAGADPSVHYTKDDLAKIPDLLSDSIKKTGVSEYVYAAVSHRLATSQFAGDKLRKLVRGEVAYPVVQHPAIEVRNRNWKVTVTEEKGKDDKTYVRPVVEVTSLRPGCGKVSLVCDSLHGRGAAGMQAILEQMAVLGYETASEETGWAKHALVIKPMGPDREWHLLLPYSAPRVPRVIDPNAAMAIHRGMANFLTAAIIRDGKVGYHYYRGGDIVAAKSEFLARGKHLRQDIAGRANGCRGRRSRYRGRAMLSDKQRRVIETAIWRAARWAQRLAEENGVGFIAIEDFGTIRADVATDQDRYLEPYIRRFPFFTLKTRVRDALTRRAGAEVTEVEAAYISQRCPACAHESPANVQRRPRARSSADIEAGSFKCEECGLPGDLDGIAALNMLGRMEHCPAGVRDALRRLAKIVTRERRKKAA